MRNPHLDERYQDRSGLTIILVGIAEEVDEVLLFMLDPVSKEAP